MNGRKKVFLRTGLIMTAAAFIFILYALNNPQASFPLSNTVTYTIYAIYAVVTAAMLILGVVVKNKK